MSIAETSLTVQESLINVRETVEEGCYKVMDGMHRVTTLHDLHDEGFIGIDYDKVTLVPQPSDPHTGHRVHLTLCMLFLSDPGCRV